MMNQIYIRANLGTTMEFGLELFGICRNPKHDWAQGYLECQFLRTYPHYSRSLKQQFQLR